MYGCEILHGSYIKVYTIAIGCKKSSKSLVEVLNRILESFGCCEVINQTLKVIKPFTVDSCSFIRSNICSLQKVC